MLQLNTEQFPKSGNAWDSLAEAYAKAGKNEIAEIYYRKSVEVDPAERACPRSAAGPRRPPRERRPAVSEALRRRVIDCAAYRDGVRVATLDHRRDPGRPRRSRALRLAGALRTGRGAARAGAGRLPPPRPGGRGRPSRPPAPEARSLRRIPVHRPAHRPVRGAGRTISSSARPTSSSARVTSSPCATARSSRTSACAVGARCESERLALGPGYVLYALLDFVVDQYFPIVEALEEQFDRIETDVFDGRQQPRDDGGALQLQPQAPVAAPGGFAAARRRAAPRALRGSAAAGEHAGLLP